MATLLSELTIKGITLKNRMVMPPLATYLIPETGGSETGGLNPKIIEHYVKRAQAGIGLIIVEHCYVHPGGKADKQQLGVHDDAMLEGLKHLAARVHSYGTRIIVQISHAGSNTTAEACNGQQPVAPSAVEHPRAKTLPRELTVAAMEEIKLAFGKAAARVKAAGFDGVEVHGAHGYLLNQFFSPLTNKRTDTYGGSLENRMRFPLEVVLEVRKQVGPAFPLFYRLGADDMMPGGLTLEESKQLAPRLVAAGVDVLDISGGLCGSRPEGAGRGYFLPLAEGIKPVVDVPIIITGGITEPEFADRIIREGKADMVGIGRALLADAAWPAKAIKALTNV